MLFKLSVSAQESGGLSIVVSENSREIINHLGISDSLRDIHKPDELKLLMNILYSHGYLLASYEALPSEDSVFIYKVETGDQYTWIQIGKGNLTDEFEKQAGIHMSDYKGQTVRYSQIADLFNRVLDYSEDHGYPFASIKLDDVQIDPIQNTLYANLNYMQGRHITYDSLIITGTRTNPSFLEAYLGFKKGDPFNKQKIDRIPKMIEKLPYLNLGRDPEIHFSDSAYSIRLDLNDRPSNNLNGLIGIFPNENRSGNVLITGMVYLGINNLFDLGKEFEFDWNKPNTQTQELTITYLHPNVFKSQMGLEFLFGLYKQDTSFLNREASIGLNFQGIRKGGLGIHTTYQSSSVIGSEVNPGFTDRLENYDLIYYGMNYDYSEYDNWIFPRNGWNMHLDFDMGSKNIKSSDTVNSVIDNRDNPVQVSFKFTLSRVLPVTNRSAFWFGLSGGHISNTGLLWNELFRLGGIYSIRGFNEKFFYASSYVYSNLEYRFLFDNESQFILFYDQGYMLNQLQYNQKNDFPAGFGSGFNIKTNFGILTLLYAVGTATGQPFGFDYSKIHVGYTNRF